MSKRPPDRRVWNPKSIVIRCAKNLKRSGKNWKFLMTILFRPPRSATKRGSKDFFKLFSITVTFIKNRMRVGIVNRAKPTLLKKIWWMDCAPTTNRNQNGSMKKTIFLNSQNISVSRASVKWGIPVPFDKTHAVYVWFDALINYITAIGYGEEKSKIKNQKSKFKKWWPADLHVIGKDITRFHCVIWPAMLMAAKIPLPKSVFGHGFVYLRGEKMSKTLGNVVTPMDVVDAYGADALRYYLLRTSSFGQDSDFTWDDFIRRYNGDLANGLGNLVSRTLGMIEQYQKGVISPVKGKTNPLAKKMKGLKKKVGGFLEMKSGDIAFHEALAAIWEGITQTDRYINENKPWKITETQTRKEILYNVAESIRTIANLLKPFLPSTAEKILEQFGSNIQKGPNLFPRIEEPKEKLMEQSKKPSEQGSREGEATTALPAEGATRAPTIDITDFAKVDMRVAQVISAEKIEGADKLLKLQIDLGNEKRQIVAGIAQHYPPEELVGRKIVVVINLKPVKIRGVESNGMLLAASDANVISILTPTKDVAVGSKIK